MTHNLARSGHSRASAYRNIHRLDFTGRDALIVFELLDELVYAVAHLLDILYPAVTHYIYCVFILYGEYGQHSRLIDYADSSPDVGTADFQGNYVFLFHIVLNEVFIMIFSINYSFSHWMTPLLPYRRQASCPNRAPRARLQDRPRSRCDEEPWRVAWQQSVLPI